MSAAAVAESNDVNGTKPSFLTRFMRNQSGSTAIEFAVLALPFSLLVFAILESCIAFAGQQVLANAADEVARQFRTGQVKAAGFSEEKLKDMICAKLEVLVSKDCKTQLLVDLQSYTTFEKIAEIRLKYTADRDIDISKFKVDPGPSMSKNMLQVIYKWPVITDFMRQRMSNLKDKKTLQYATVTWQNEPFND